MSSRRNWTWRHHHSTGEEAVVLNINLVTRTFGELSASCHQTVRFSEVTSPFVQSFPTTAALAQHKMPAKSQDQNVFPNFTGDPFQSVVQTAQTHEIYHSELFVIWSIQQSLQRINHHSFVGISKYDTWQSFTLTNLMNLSKRNYIRTTLSVRA